MGALSLTVSAQIPSDTLSLWTDHQVRFAKEVWRVDPAGKTDEQIAEEGLLAMQDWMREIGVACTMRDLGANEDMIEGMTKR